MKTWQVLMLVRSDRTVSGPPIDNPPHPHLEDLERLALDKIEPEERAPLDAHLNQCGACRQMLEEARGFGEQLAQLAGSENPAKERRRAVRYTVNEPATIALCNPPEFVPVPGEIVDASSLGLLVRVPRGMHRGAQVYIQVENAAVFGTIRYCRANADKPEVEKTYDIGIAIDQVVMRPGLAAALDSFTGVPVSPGPAEAKPRTFEILCIEDNPGDVRLVEMILEDIPIPHHLSVARDGVQALQQLRDATTPKPDLVLLDLNLPKISGLEFLERVRKDDTLHILPVVILSSSAARGDLERAAALGVKAYFRKPEDLARHSELRCSMETLITELAGVSS